MKLFTAEQIRTWDAYTMQHEPILSLDLMERASHAFVEWYVARKWEKYPVYIFCGIGNNGGDGLAIARMLHRRGFTVQVWVVAFSVNTSADFAANRHRLQECLPIGTVQSTEELPEIPPQAIIVDALLGSGLSRPAEGLVLSAIQHINRHKGIVVAVDIASGLFSDRFSPSLETSVVHPTHTVSFQAPKVAFFMPENAIAVRKWHTVSIGLHPAYEAHTSTPYFYVDPQEVQYRWQPRDTFSHKGTFGHALMIAGSYGKIGAAVLATKAVLRAGAGLVTAYVPSCGYAVLQSIVPEAMCLTDSHREQITEFPPVNSYRTIGIGPGLGKASATRQALFKFLDQTITAPLVLDADAINLLSAHPKLLEKVPSQSVFTPHPKEFERLVGETAHSFERLDALVQFCQIHRVFVVLKGAHTAIGTPEGKVYFNSTGNPGMATAGSGDVLTGILTGLLAQPYTTEDAVLLGVYLHGIAADFAMEEQSQESLVATDLIAYLGKAFQHIAQLGTPESSE